MVRATRKTPGIRAKHRVRKEARILAAARALLRQRGYELLSLRDVARRAGVSPAGMYEFFDSREHLVEALAAEASGALTAALRIANGGETDAVGRLVSVGLAYIRFAQERPADFRLLFGRRSARRSLDEAVPADSEYMVIRTAVEELLGAGGNGGVGQRVVEVLAYGFWSTIHGMAVLQFTHLAGFDADFATADRLLLENTARSWQRVDWRRVTPPAAAAGRGESGGL